ncbi:MAG: GmrSD restriction endonuclease domain-containing protein, partial [Limisphaerales bacterium]
VLLRATDNSGLKSAAFEIKRPILASSPYVLTNQIGTVNQWDPDAITERQIGLATLAVKAWPI